MTSPANTEKLRMAARNLHAAYLLIKSTDDYHATQRSLVGLHDYLVSCAGDNIEECTVEQTGYRPVRT